ncbi:MAG: DNA polymerase domain-containing protein, partial [Nanoarchaeota archaeon]|nr:DNA polymerase domain-containing protein [Nanoarchaeota archaeon]
LVYDILEKSKVLQLSIRRSMLTRMQLDRVSGSIASFDSLYLRALKEQKIVAPTAIINDREERIKGGFVMESKPGVYDTIVVLDFKSMYPSIIRTFNIDPLNFIPKEKYARLPQAEKELLIESPNGAHFRNENGILPQLIQQLWEQRDAAKKRKDLLASQAIKILMNCFSADTQIMTEQGIKNIKEVRVGEKVYSLNPKTGNAELHPVVKTFAYDYKGKMIRLASGSVDFLVTPNHRFLVSDGKTQTWKEAEQLARQTGPAWLPKHTKISGKMEKSVDLVQLCKKHGISFRTKEGKLQKGPKHSSLPATFAIKDWLAFLGWYLSEGFIYTTTPKRYAGKVSWRGISRKVSISQKIRKGREDIEKLLRRMGLRCHLDVNGVFVCNHILAEILEKEAGMGSMGKRIPSWVFRLDSALLQHLFATLMQGDGNANGQRYSTCSKGLAEDVLRLIHHLGLFGFVYEDIFDYKGAPYVMYRVQINKNRGIQPYISKYRNITQEPYDGKVFCVEVQPHHTVLAGRNYKLQFCGQSFFGILANPHCRFYNIELANAITHFGQFLNKLAAEKVREQGYDVIYADTDSLFIDAPGSDPATAERIGKELEEYINAFFAAYIRKHYNRESFLQMEYDRVFKKFLMPRVRNSEEGAKKRYAGLVEEDGKEEMVIVGLEFVRRDWTTVAKTFQMGLLEHIFHGQPIEQYVRNFVAELRKGKMDKDLIYKKSIRKDVSEYTKTTPPHIKAARKLGRELPGIIEYVMTTNGPEPLEKNPSPLDYEHYLEKQIKPIADAILSFQNKSFEDIISTQKQTGLSQFG